MERRLAVKNLGFFLGGTAFASGITSVAALAQKTPPLKNGANHSAGGAVGSAGGEGLKYVRLSQEIAKCIRACEVCIAHCHALLAKGDTMLAECLRRCLDLVPLCEATGTLANYGSELTVKTARVCLEACEACAASCKPHVGHHDICKACYEACLACSEACKAA